MEADKGSSGKAGHRKSGQSARASSAKPPEPQEWTDTGLLDHFKQANDQHEDRPFCFILGAGASKSSGISTGGELVEQWLGELQRQKLGEHRLPPLRERATEKNLGIPGFTYKEAATFYPQVYDVRFGDNPNDGYGFLEHEIKGRESRAPLLVRQSSLELRQSSGNVRQSRAGALRTSGAQRQNPAPAPHGSLPARQNSLPARQNSLVSRQTSGAPPKRRVPTDRKRRSRRRRPKTRTRVRKRSGNPRPWNPAPANPG